MGVDHGEDRLTLAECLGFLRGQRVGRVTLAEGDSVLVLPVNYVLLDDLIVLSSGETTMLTAARSGIPISFEVDDNDDDDGQGASVLVRGGGFEVIPSTLLARTGNSELASWVIERGAAYTVAIRIESISGRRLRATPDQPSVVDRPGTDSRSSQFACVLVRHPLVARALPTPSAVERCE